MRLHERNPRYVANVLERHGGDRAATARTIGVSRRTFSRWVREYAEDVRRLDRQIAEVAVRVLREELARCDGNKSAVARSLGMSVRTVGRWLAKNTAETLEERR